MSIAQYLYKLLDKVGIHDWVHQLQFGVHLGWGLFFGSLSYFVSYWIGVIWCVFVLLDEFYFSEGWKLFFEHDEVKAEDTLWDLGSKLFGVCLSFLIMTIEGLI